MTSQTARPGIRSSSSPLAQRLEAEAALTSAGGPSPSTGEELVAAREPNEPADHASGLNPTSSQEVDPTYAPPSDPFADEAPFEFAVFSEHPQRRIFLIEALVTHKRKAEAQAAKARTDLANPQGLNPNPTVDQFLLDDALLTSAKASVLLDELGIEAPSAEA